MPEIPATTEELYRLYQQGWSLQRVADKYGVSKQAIQYRLSVAACPRRGRGSARVFLNDHIDVDEFERLYIQQGLGLRQIAREMNMAVKVLRAKIKEHPRMRKMKRGSAILPELNRLKIGESFLMPRAARRGANYTRYYLSAHRHGIRVSVTSASETEMRITRVS